MNHSSTRLKTAKLIFSLSILYLCVTGQRWVSESVHGSVDFPVSVRVSLGGSAGSTLNFRITMESLTAELPPYELAKMVVLRSEGKEYEPVVRSLEESTRHQAAEIEFNKPPHAEEVEVVVRGVGGNNVRIFKFRLQEKG